MRSFLDKCLVFLFFCIPLLNLLFDVLRSHFPAGSGIGTIQDMILLAISLYFMLFYPKILSQNIWITSFLIYTLLLTFFSSNSELSYTYYIEVLIIHLLLPISFFVIRTREDLAKLHIIISFCLLIFVINGTICMALGIGPNHYGGRFRLGAFVMGRLYPISFFVFLLPIILKDIENKTHRIIILACSLLSLVYLILSMRRTSIIIVIIGFFIYFLLSRNKKLILKGILIAIPLLVIAFPTYKDLLIDGIVNRQEAFHTGYDIEEELRYKETLIVFEESFGNQVSWWKTLLGKDVWATPGSYGDGIYGERPLHVDYNKLIHSTGIIGTFLYLMIFISVLFNYVCFVKCVPLKTNDYFNDLHAIFIAFFILNLFLMTTGHIYSVGFRSIIMIYLGGITGIFSEVQSKINNVQH